MDTLPTKPLESLSDRATTKQGMDAASSCRLERGRGRRGDQGAVPRDRAGLCMASIYALEARLYCSFISQEEEAQAARKMLLQELFYGSGQSSSFSSLRAPLLDLSTLSRDSSEGGALSLSRCLPSRKDWTATTTPPPQHLQPAGVNAPPPSLPPCLSNRQALPPCCLPSRGGCYRRGTQWWW